MIHGLIPQALLWTSLLLAGAARAAVVPRSVTVYGVFGAQPLEEIGQGPLATPDNQQFLKDLQAYNDVRLEAPTLAALPSPTYALQLANGADKVVGLSGPARGDFLGFSIEMSVVESVSASFFFFPRRSRVCVPGVSDPDPVADMQSDETRECLPQPQCPLCGIAGVC